MTQTFAEILILIPSTLHAGLVLFVAFVLQPIMSCCKISIAEAGKDTSDH